MSKCNKYLYAFCGETSYIEKYNVLHNYWEDVEWSKPATYGTRYGIKTIPIWNTGFLKKNENSVLVFGGD